MAQADSGAHIRRFPALQGVLPIDPKRVPADIIAGITLAALAIPEVMGYTKIAGMPVITGLYTILVPIAVFALLGSSRHLVVGADSATAAILFAGLVGLAQPYSAEWVALAGWCAILAAGFLVLARILRLGFLADFLSSTVLIGFLTGVGVQVACGQIAGFLGVTKTGNGPITQALNAIKDIPQANRATVAVSAGVLIVIVGSRLISKRIPGALIAVIGAIAASEIWNLSALGVTTLGTVPSGLPHFGLPALPPTSAWGTLVATAASLFLVILAQSAATSRAYAVKYDETDFQENVDLVGLGLSNVAAGLSGTFVVNGSPTKTQMVDGAGGRSQLAQLTTAVITLVVLLFLTKPLSYMPNAVLAAVVFLIGVELVDVKGMAGVYKLRPVEFWVALITAATVVVVGVEQGILLAIGLSLVVHIRHSYRPTDLLVTYTGGEGRTHPLASGEQAAPGLAIYHFGADLFYANSEAFQSEILNLVETAEPKLEWLVLDASAMGDIDYTGVATLGKLIPMLAEKGVTLAAMNVSPELLAELDRSNLADLRSGKNVYPGVKDVVTAFGEFGS
jgi:sulfate permease, SulP family